MEWGALPLHTTLAGQMYAATSNELHDSSGNSAQHHIAGRTPGSTYADLDKRLSDAFEALENFEPSAMLIRVRAPSGAIVWGPAIIDRLEPVANLRGQVAGAVGSPDWMTLLRFRGEELCPEDPLPTGVPDGAELQLIVQSAKQAAQNIYSRVSFPCPHWPRRRRDGDAGSRFMKPRAPTGDALSDAVAAVVAAADGTCEDMKAWIEVLLEAGDFHVLALPGILYLEDGDCNFDSCLTSQFQYWWVDLCGYLGGGRGAVWCAHVYGDDVSDYSVVSEDSYGIRFPSLGFWRFAPKRGWIKAPSRVSIDLARFFGEWGVSGRKPGKSHRHVVGSVRAISSPSQ